MKKFLFIIAVTFLTATSLQAQYSRKVLFSVGVEPALPMGKFNDFGYNFGIGGSLQAEVKVAKELGITLNGGYINYSAKKGDGFGIIPVLGGAKFYTGPKVYLHGQLGIGFGTEKIANTYFAYTPGVGIMLSKNFDVLLKYVGYSANNTTLSSIAARVAYNF